MSIAHSGFSQHRKLCFPPFPLSFNPSLFRSSLCYLSFPIPLLYHSTLARPNFDVPNKGRPSKSPITLSLSFLLLFRNPSPTLTNIMLPSIIVALALSVSYSVAAAPPQGREALHIPVARRHNLRRGNGLIDEDRLAAAVKDLKKKYRHGSSHSRRAQSTDIGITNQVTSLSRTTGAIGISVSWCVAHNYRTRIRRTLPKLASALRECSPLRMSFCSCSLTRSIVVHYAQAPEHAGRPRHGVVRPLVHHHRLPRLHGGDTIV